MRKIFTLLVACLQLFCLATAAEGDKADFSSLDSRNFYQGKTTAGELRGKVVFIEYWGINCPPCRAAMPKLQEMYDKYKNKGFVLIASHCQMAPADAIKNYLRENKLTFPTCEQFHLPQAPIPGGIPHSVLIGANGRVVATGYPTKLEPMVEGELKKLAGGVPILGDLELKKHAKLKSTIVEGAPDIESKINALRDKTDDEEAQKICTAYDEWLELRKQSISNTRKSDALEFIRQAAELKKSVPSLTDFDESVDAVKADPAYAQLVEFNKKYKALSKKLEEGKKVSPKAIEALVSALSKVKSDNESVAGSVDALKESFTTMKSEAEGAAQASKKAAKEAKESAKEERRSKRESKRSKGSNSMMP